MTLNKNIFACPHKINDLFFGGDKVPAAWPATNENLW